MAKGGSLLINPAFYRSLCERDGWEGRIPMNFSKVTLMHDKEVRWRHSQYASKNTDQSQGSRGATTARRCSRLNVGF